MYNIEQYLKGFLLETIEISYEKNKAFNKIGVLTNYALEDFKIVLTIKNNKGRIKKLDFLYPIKYTFDNKELALSYKQEDFTEIPVSLKELLNTKKSSKLLDDTIFIKTRIS